MWSKNGPLSPGELFRIVVVKFHTTQFAENNREGIEKNESLTYVATIKMYKHMEKPSLKFIYT